MTINKFQRDTKTGQFLQGISGNPTGRPRGARNTLSEAFLEALQQDFVRGGAAAGDILLDGLQVRGLDDRSFKANCLLSAL